MYGIKMQITTICQSVPKPSVGYPGVQPPCSLFNEIRQNATASNPPAPQRAKTAVGATRGQTDYVEETKEQIQTPPEWLEKEMIRRQQRRYSLGLVDNVLESLQNFSDPARSLRKEKLEHQVTLEQLHKLKKAFEELEKNGHKSVDVDAFKWAVKKSTGLRATSDEQIEKLFMKIDFTATGKIQWEQFCTYMQLDYSELEDSYLRRSKISFMLPATIQEIVHGDPIARIFLMQDNTLIMVREDGHIYFWSTQLKLKRDKAIFEKSLKKMPKWVTDFTIMTQYNKLVLATGDREIQLYELSNLEPYCQITGLETMPLKVDYCATDSNECMILYGDDKGCVNILLFTSIGETLRMWKKMPRPDNIMPTIVLESAILSPHVTLIRWKVHRDWVTQMKYYDSIKAVISASNDESTALAIGCTLGTTNVEQQMKDIKEHGRDLKGRRGAFTPGPPQKRASGDQTVFRIYKGVKTFAFCKKNSLVVTGGMDRIIRMWNLYVPARATGMLRGHTAPIFFLEVSSEDNKIFSVATDNTVKIWDIQSHSCLFTACSKSSGIRGELTACLYIPEIRALCLTTDSISLLQVKLKASAQPHLDSSHKDPVLCCKYNKAFRQVVTCSEGSAVKVWDFETGKQVFEFNDAHRSSGITCMTFDPSGRRLITGGRDGCLKVWNYNNGQCLHTLRRANKSDEICDCTYVEINRNKYIVGVGWDRRITMYIDSDDDLHHFQEPQPGWHDDLIRGHREDILCIAQNPPNLLASSSYDGEIIIWNMISGHIQCRINTSIHVDSAGMKLTDRSVSKILFLKTRTVKLQGAASLVSNGPLGYVNFWNIFQGGKLAASFKPSRTGCQVSSLAVTKDNSLMFVADYIGYIYVYNIKDYAVQGPEKDPPPFVKHWRAHVDIITDLEVIDEDKVVLSSSLDCTARLWSIDGEFIGTFGQADPWEVFTPASWKHPMVPYEILIDPESMPVHPVLEQPTDEPEEMTTQETEEPKETLDIKIKNEINYNAKSSLLTVTEEDIQEEINKQNLSHSNGKRLRHEKYKMAHKPLDHGGPNAFHNLQCFDLENNPVSFEKPDMSVAGTDPFQSFVSS
ncbi:WD repeat-containing protein on Y chromosome-like isoform X1 [Hyla sarda]|uniref:WD repeat-containing protein on Y chromosome-like isoform X1 n=2 Tax=Hyla sarda TaxID=327740 RepID=UPI0024C3679D|nr:WD repeat-containing protein on Y chromosome-like isoform X1 [Hyla sarda]